jgi:2,4-dienoyl-CoA reductase-like NADH-dependent reductase (Old Yellow Enzyme family)
MPNLFDPLRLGSLELANRVVVAPMCQYSANDGCASDWHVQHLSQLGYSGAALVVVEATAVERRGRISHGCLGLYNDANEHALRSVLASARRYAGNTRFGIQLAHAGRKGSAQRPWEGDAPLPADEDPWQTVSSSAVRFSAGWPAPKALSSAELDSVVEAFAAAAQRAVRIGFDVIELHCAHGYLLHEFLSPLANQRTDDYGGSLTNRMRLPLAVIKAVRAVVPDSIPLGLRVSASDWVEGGWDLQQSIALARAAGELGVQFVCASSGGIVADATVPAAPGFQVTFAQQIKRATGLATRAVGLITRPMQAQRIIAEGQADMIALARAFLDDPRWAWHAADALGASVACPAPYQRARGAGWRRLRDGDG